jgi:signal transduction histidine kinase/PAS domain-containing protein
VEHVPSIEEALALLKDGHTFTFVFADRILQGLEIERNLVSLRKAARNAHLIVYTQESELSPSQRAEIHAAGAIRVLGKKRVDELVEDIAVLLREFADLLELREEIGAATVERSRLVAALVGSNIGVSILDTHYHCWFANEKQKAIVGGSPVGFPCWLRFHDHPLVSGVCYGCAVAEVIASGKATERPFLAKMSDGSVRWVSVRALPIFSREEPGRIIAVREGVSDDTEMLVRSMTRHERLLRIAHGLLHAGFGRVRIYEIRKGTGTLSLVAAAAVTDDVARPESVYERGLPPILDPSQCKYASEAMRNRTGCFVDSWDRYGVSPYAEVLALDPPYFDVPITGSDNEPCALLAVDFGLVSTLARPGESAEEAERRCSATIRSLGKQDSLVWLREGYGREVRQALEADPVIVKARPRYEEVWRARMNMGLTRSVAEAGDNLRQAFQNVVPGCRVSVRLRVRDREELEEWQDYSVPGQAAWAPPKIIRTDDHTSLAAYVVGVFRRPIWIDDYQAYAAGAEARGLPAGYCAPNTRSTASIPLRFEEAVYGVLSIESYERISWEEEGYTGPLELLADLASLVLRDGVLYEEARKGSANKTALSLAAMDLSADHVWKEATTERLQELALCVGHLRRLSADVQDDGLRKHLLTSIGALRLLVSKIVAGARRADDDEDTCALSEVFGDLAREYGRRVAVVVPAGDCVLAAGKRQLHKIIRILVENAMAAIRKHGAVAETRVDVQELGDQQVLLGVTDFGPGIPREIERAILLEPVAGADPDRGFDLILARGIALRFGGDLILSSPRQPTRFVLRVPRFDGDTAGTAARWP